MDRRVANLEEKVPAQEKTSAAQIRELEELGAAVGDRIGMLEQFYGGADSRSHRRRQLGP
jgi:hypothetical protein